MRPRIGITTSYNDGKQSIDHYYIQAIEAAGAVPIIAPMLTTQDTAQAFASILDGLIITGGPGITRGLIGDLPEDLSPVDPIRDESDRLIYEAFAEQRPLLGICYGMQFINAMHGGTIFADVTQQQSHAINHSNGRGADPHFVNIVEGTKLYRTLDTSKIKVNTYHIQAVDSVGEGLRVSATAPDGIIEAIESSDGRIMGVQFHPERMGDSMMPLFKDFVARCQR
ncbi:MAG: gamma-glutamyl-gamma-aminobutyrate hydrolase family protein [Phototrophicaceae bacterium]